MLLHVRFLSMSSMRKLQGSLPLAEQCSVQCLLWVQGTARSVKTWPWSLDNGEVYVFVFLTGETLLSGYLGVVRKVEEVSSLMATGKQKEKETSWRSK